MAYAKLQQLNNAQTYMSIALQQCQTDPLIFNENGTILYGLKRHFNIFNGFLDMMKQLITFVWV
jgi:hypothetical protein